MRKESIIAIYNRAVAKKKIKRESTPRILNFKLSESTEELVLSRVHRERSIKSPSRRALVLSRGNFCLPRRTTAGLLDSYFERFVNKIARHTVSIRGDDGDGRIRSRFYGMGALSAARTLTLNDYYVRR